MGSYYSNCHLLGYSKQVFCTYHARTCDTNAKCIIVTFVQAVSNIQSLAKVLPFLTVLEELPTTVVGIIQGIFPAIALAILVALVPIIFRCKLSLFVTYEILTYDDLVLSVQEGIPQNSMVDLSLLHKYFFFLVSYYVFILSPR